jgi:predicted SAM-dependent methyltransferase
MRVHLMDYSGKRLPFGSASQDALFVSHTLEHIDDYRGSIADWFRVLRVGGFLIIAAPHQFLYERSLSLPSRFNADHRRF